MKETFILKTIWQSVFNDLNDRQAGVLIKAVFSYIATGEKLELTDSEVKMAFKFIKLDLDGFRKKYEVQCDTNRINSLKGGAPVGNQNAIKQPKTTEGLKNNRRVVLQSKTTEGLKNNLNDDDNDDDSDSVVSKETTCSERLKIASEQDVNKSPPLITLILNDKSEYGITVDQVDEWSLLYPAVDVMQELRKMKGWCVANIENRKTRRGVLRFVNSWLSKSQDSSRKASVYTANSPPVSNEMRQVNKFLGGIDTFTFLDNNK